MKLKIAVGIALIIFMITVAATLAAGFVVMELRRESQIPSLPPTATASATPVTLNPVDQNAVASHSNASDCWLLINGNAYNVTSYLYAHPGGAAIIIPFCGKDATEAFNTKGGKGQSHSQLATQLLTNYLVLIAKQTMVAPSTTPTMKVNLIKNTTTDLAAHNTAADCRLLISGKTYDVTSYLHQHPGGVNAITPFCGKEATHAFKTQGGFGSDHSDYAYMLLQNYLLNGTGSNLPITSPTSTPTKQPTNPPLPTTANLTLTISEVAAHNAAANCWVVINNTAYNVTSYLYQHPGGVNAITPFCGKDATTAFQTKGGKGSNHSSFAYSLLNSYTVGTLNSNVSTPQPSLTSAVPLPTQSSSQLPSAVAAKYPSATLISSNNEDDGRIEIKISVYGQCREVKIDSQGRIQEDQKC